MYIVNKQCFVNISDCISDLCCFITNFRKPTKLNTMSTSSLLLLQEHSTI